MPFSLTFCAPSLGLHQIPPSSLSAPTDQSLRSQRERDISRINGLLERWDGSARSIWPLVLCMYVCTHSLWLDLTDHRCSTPDFSAPTPPHSSPSTIPTHGSWVLSQVLAPFASKFILNLTSSRRPAQSRSRTERVHTRPVSPRALSRWFLGTISTHLWVCLGRVQRPRLPAAHLHVSSYPGPPIAPIRIWHSSRIDIVLLSRYHCTISPPQTALALFSVGNRFKLGSTSASCPPAPLPRLPSSTAPRPRFCTTTRASACSCQVAVQTALSSRVSRNPCRLRSGEGCIHMPFVLLH